MKKVIIIGVIIVTLCIIYLTSLAGDSFKSSIQAQDVRNELIMNSANIDSSCCINTLPTYQKDSALMDKDSSLAAKQPVIVEKDSITANKRSNKSITNSPNFLDSIVFNLTLAVNAVNNVLTSGSIFIAILTLFIGLVGLFGFYSVKQDLKDKIDEFETEINNINTKVTDNEDKITKTNKLIQDCCSETNEKYKDFENRFNESLEHNLAEIDIRNQIVNASIQDFQNFHSRQEAYINQTINYLYQATSAIINQMSDQDQARTILSRIYHDIQIARLYRTSLNAENNVAYDRDRFAAFAYLETNGTIEDIPHLQYVEQHDPNENNRRRAIEVIAIIRNRG